MSAAVIRVSAASDIGRVRQKNDDHFLIRQSVGQASPISRQLAGDDPSLADYGLLCAIADGMGGYAGGGEASRVLLESLTERFYAEKRTGASAAQLGEAVTQCIQQAHGLLQAHLRRVDLADAGTTLAGIALMSPDILVIFHVGDSRVQRAAGGYVRPLTIDHTPVGGDVATGRLTEEQAMQTGLASRLTRSLGLTGDGTPEVQDGYRWSVGDTFLIGSDGFSSLTGGLKRDALASFLRAAIPAPNGALFGADSRAADLVTHAVSADGSDNTSLVLVEIVGDSDENADEEE